MPCSIRAALITSLYYVTCSVKFFFLFFYLFSLFVAKLFTSLFRTHENEDGMEYEEDEEDEEYDQEEEDERLELEVEEYRYTQVESEHLVADIVNGGEELVFLTENSHLAQQSLAHAHSHSIESVFNDHEEAFDPQASLSHIRDSPTFEFDHYHYEDDNGIINHELIKENPVTTVSSPEEVSEITNAEKKVAEQREVRKIEEQKQGLNFTKDEKFLNFRPPKSEARKLQVLDEENDNDMFGDSHTVGSTSKSSSDWRSSIRDSATEDLFSSSSRRSCRKWESYTLYQKYDEEMMFLGRISAQKLQETESLRSFQVEPKSISHRIVHKLVNKKKSSDRIYQTYRDLEAAYVAQICIAWEALNWNYANFLRKRAAKTGPNSGYPALVAQEFQHFQVLLQRYIENEPYEQGRRPEIYAKMRSVNSKLLQVPEYQDYEEEQKEEVVRSRISSESFLAILEDAIRTYMNFLKADRQSRCRVIAALFRGRRRGSIDPALIKITKKNNKKKKLKVKELQRPRNNCFKSSKLPRDKDMEILMSLIDLKVVSRVLRMKDITQEQLQWCEGKLAKIRISQGKLQRDPSPLFFPPNIDIGDQQIDLAKLIRMH